MSLGTAAIPFSLTSGNILKRAISMAYMLDIAPPKGSNSNTQWPFVVLTNSISHASTILYFQWPRLLLGHRERPYFLVILWTESSNSDWILKLGGSREGIIGPNRRTHTTPLYPNWTELPIDSAFAGTPLKRFFRTEKLLPSFAPWERGHSSLGLWKSYFYPDGENSSFCFNSGNVLYLH